MIGQTVKLLGLNDARGREFAPGRENLGYTGVIVAVLPGFDCLMFRCCDASGLVLDISEEEI